VFDTDSYVFGTTGIAGISATKYNVEADKTLFVAPTHLFKGDLKVLNPKSGSSVSGQGLEIKWEPYPNAAYYKLSLYPDDLKLGFSVADWRDLCLSLDARDDEPFDRDERRAWYDTLRDLVPTVYGFAPTARLYGGAHPWCSLDIASIHDRKRFLGWISTRLAGNP